MRGRKRKSIVTEIEQCLQECKRLKKEVKENKSVQNERMLSDLEEKVSDLIYEKNFKKVYESFKNVAD